MKRYFVNITFGESGNDPIFSSKNLEEARQAYIEEVEKLHNEYTHIKSLGYSPSEKEVRNAIYAELFSIDDEVEEQIDELEVIETSDYFFDERN